MNNNDLGKCELCQASPANCYMTDYFNGKKVFQLKVCLGCEEILDDEEEDERNSEFVEEPY